MLGEGYFVGIIWVRFVAVYRFRSVWVFCGLRDGAVWYPGCVISAHAGGTWL